MDKKKREKVSGVSPGAFKVMREYEALSEVDKEQLR
jgi:hypothetical protein